MKPFRVRSGLALLADDAQGVPVRVRTLARH